MDVMLEKLAVESAPLGYTPEFYDMNLQERSPYTGMIASSTSQKGHLVESADSLASSSAISRATQLRWVHLMAVCLVLVLVGVVAFVAMSAYDAATVTAAPKSSIQAGVTIIDSETMPITKSVSNIGLEKKDSGALSKSLETLTNPIQLRAIETAPNPKIALHSVGTELPTLSGKTYEELLEMAKKGPVKKRAELLREAISINKNGDDALATLAIIMMDRRASREEAFEFANRALEINVDNAMAWLAVGYLNQMRGKAKEAREAYLKCATLTGGHNIRWCKKYLYPF